MEGKGGFNNLASAIFIAIKAKCADNQLTSVKLSATAQIILKHKLQAAEFFKKSIIGTYYPIISATRAVSMTFPFSILT